MLRTVWFVVVSLTPCLLEWEHAMLIATKNQYLWPLTASCEPRGDDLASASLRVGHHGDHQALSNKLGRSPKNALTTKGTIPQACSMRPNSNFASQLLSLCNATRGRTPQVRQHRGGRDLYCLPFHCFLQLKRYHRLCESGAEIREHGSFEF